MLTSQLITGTFSLVLGLVLIGFGFITHFISLFYGIPLFIVGLFILFNSQEDEIENRKDLKVRGTKK